MQKVNYVLDIGSSKLCLLAIANVDKQPRIIASEQVLYDGYMNGEFLSPETLTDDISTAIKNMANKMHLNITKITIGVPSEFCICKCKRVVRKFLTLTKINQNILQDLFSSNAQFGDSVEYELINYSPMKYLLDDELETMSPIGKKTTNISIDVSFILAKKSFIDMMSKMMQGINIQCEFVCTMLGQATKCAKDNDLIKPFALVDVGHISTSVCVYKGEGLALLSSFSVGGGYISSDIMKVLNLNFNDAEMVKRKVILPIDSKHNEKYEIFNNDSAIIVPINLTNQVVKSRIEMIASVIKDVLGFDDVYKDIDVYVTGDGIANFKGYKNILKDVIGRDIFDYKNNFDNSLTKFQTSQTGLAMLVEAVI